MAKRGRERFVLLPGDALREPDEIWVDWAQLRSGQVALRRHYLSRVAVPGGDSLVTVFEWTRHGWHGVTAFDADGNDLENLRRGALLCRR